MKSGFMTIFDAIGIIGVTIILITYFLLQTGKIKVEQTLYSALNMLGALLILISLFFDWNLASVVIEVFWILISLYGVLKSLARRRKA